ncbi:IniB N-terminal domain-containing protein [Amycolatopsis sp. PS_44_ISF1]|uniref:IniB N-terminal domain-containing protein n=1 Tax=Amycolatopsis sp. PS_44_ISF1 TaxID=2974917 RepID=UPI0028E097AC|nr:IniB N-terminal domain-containing protein [Amycolatopsis sp. PS_44_ISF1]MDT8913430.1 IniB N-terminal domain-containing protein [Amycolatopsis sp. PS_44_ISF1]
MGPVQTLHEFALNLLRDPQALAEYNANPQEVLNGAGLSDLSAADVHDVMPLVMDIVPVPAAGSPAGFATGDLTGTLDHLTSSAPRADALHGVLPRESGVLTGVFGEASDVAGETGLNTVTHGVLTEASGALDSGAGATGGVPLVGPMAVAGAIDTRHTTDAVGGHVFDGKLVGSAVDATTNHLGDALLWRTVVAETATVPVAGAPLAGGVEGVRMTGAGLLGEANHVAGSTPVGVNAENLQPHGDFGPAGELSGTLDPLTSVLPVAVPAGLPVVPAVAGGALPAVPVLPAVPAVPAAGVPALPATSDTSSTVGSVTHTLTGAATHLPVVGDAMDHTLTVTGDHADTGLRSDAVVTHLTDPSHSGNLVSGLENQAHDLTSGLDLHHGAESALDGLHFGH